MKLRTRVTLLVILIVAAAVVGGAYAAYFATSRELRSQTDELLVERAKRSTDHPINSFEASPPQAPGGPGGSRGAGSRDRGREPFVEDDAVSQVIDQNGNIFVPGAAQLPVGDEDRALARASGPNRLRDVVVNGVHYRMITASIPGGGAVEVARDVTATDEVLAKLRNLLVVIASLGTLLAGCIAWLVARRTTRPIERLTQASEHVAATQDLTVPIPETGTDEVGRLAHSFNTMLLALDTSRQQQKRLVMDASHELRTPLTALRTNIEFLRRAETLDVEQRRELLDETRLELDEITNLVTELVELATDARTDEPITEVDLSDLADEVATRFRRRTGRDIELTTELTGVPEPSLVSGRRSMLDRALSNLVDNALKFSEAPSPIEVVVGEGTVRVLDRGVGIEEGEHNRLFDRFYRTESARTRPGSGLGLAIVKQIAEVHGGTVSLASRDGGGSVAQLDLHAARANGSDRPVGASADL